LNEACPCDGENFGKVADEQGTSLFCFWALATGRDADGNTFKPIVSKRAERKCVRHKLGRDRDGGGDERASVLSVRELRGARIALLEDGEEMFFVYFWRSRGNFADFVEEDGCRDGASSKRTMRLGDSRGEAPRSWRGSLSSKPGDGGAMHFDDELGCES